MSARCRAFAALALASAAALHWTAARTAAVPNVSYHLVVDELLDLGALFGHSRSEAHAINANGAIAGSSESASGTRRAVFWKTPQSLPQNLGHLGGGWSEAWGINNAAVVVGNTRSSSDAGDNTRAFRWSAGSGMTDLGVTGDVLGNGVVVTSTAEDINNIGVVVGNFRHQGSASAGYMLGFGKMIVPVCEAPDSFILESTAQAINDDGYFTGHVDCAYEGGSLRPYRATLSELIEITPAENSGGDRGYGISSNGLVVGGMIIVVNGAPRYHAFRWSPSSGRKDLHPLGDTTFKGVARDINANGLIVGSRYTDEYSQAFVYGQGIGMTPLPSLCPSRVPRADAYAVNDSGWVVGTSRTCSGDFHATLWKVRVVAVPIL